MFFAFTLNTFSAEPEVKSLNLSFDDFTVTSNEEKEKEGKEQSSINKLRNSIDEFFDRSVQKIETIKKQGTDGLNNLQKQERRTRKLTTKQNPASLFPDPFFYDAIYKEKNKFITYLYIYNDKSNRDNNYIPKIVSYNMMQELFLLAKSSQKISKFYELFHASREDKTFNINAVDEFGNTLLLTALRNGNFEIFFFLLTQNANVNICNKASVCPIQLAVYSNNINAVQAMCEKNVNINVRDKNGLLVMQYAIYQRNIEVFNLLLARYLKYSPNQKERIELIEFTENIGMEEPALKMRKAFYLQ
jgi:ankyrin repeat protein